MKILTRKQIESALDNVDLYDSIKAGFIAYSNGKCVVPPVGELLMDKGEVHIKYGYIKGDDNYVIKIASGFYDNPAQGLASSNGLVQVFDLDTGLLKAILLDEGILTDQRTAVAGALCASAFAHQHKGAVAIVGSGTQAKLQAIHLKQKLGINQVTLWARDYQKAQRLKVDLERVGFDAKVNTCLESVCRAHRLIVTTTPSQTPLIKASWILPGTHITAVGADTPNKQELESELVAKANWIIADSISQCQTRGEIASAINGGNLKTSRIIELGDALQRPINLVPSDITIADLTGVAVQDIKIAEAMLQACS